MNLEEAVDIAGLPLRERRTKTHCPQHSDSDPSLHLYWHNDSWYCFSCLKSGDPYDLLKHAGVEGYRRPRSGRTAATAGLAPWQVEAGIDEMYRQLGNLVPWSDLTFKAKDFWGGVFQELRYELYDAESPRIKERILRRYEAWIGTYDFSVNYADVVKEDGRVQRSSFQPATRDHGRRGRSRLRRRRSAR